MKNLNYIKKIKQHNHFQKYETAYNRWEQLFSYRRSKIVS